MAVIKSKLKTGEKVTGKFVSVDTETNKVTITENGKETIVSVNSMTAEYVDVNFADGDDITIEFDGKDYDVE